VLWLAAAGGWVDPICGSLHASPAVTFHRLHADGIDAWLVTDGYIWQICALAAWTGGFLPSTPSTIRLIVVIVGLLLMLFLRRIYVAGLRRRLGWRFWPSLALLAGAGSALTLWLLVSATG
jgi:hypothetical protein